MTVDSLNLVLIRKRPFKPVFDYEFFPEPLFDLLILKCDKYERVLPVVDSDLRFPCQHSEDQISRGSTRGKIYIQKRYIYEKRERQ